MAQLNRGIYSRFSVNPVADVSRSGFDRPNEFLGTGNAGDLIPVYVDQIYPGDTVKMRAKSLVRMSTPIHPVMGSAFVDTHFFFVPYRLVWEHWKDFMGENNTSYWNQKTDFAFPVQNSPKDGYNFGTVADFIGIRPKTPFLGDNDLGALEMRAYAKIYNDWWRNENVDQPALEIITDGNQGVPLDWDDPIQSAVHGGALLKASKFPDYFTTALPSPQKGEDVIIPLGAYAPVTTRNAFVPNYSSQGPVKVYSSNIMDGYEHPIYAQGTGVSQGALSAGPDNGSALNDGNLSFSNLWADLANASAATISQLRMAFSIQRMLEKDARGGTRYIELILSHFSVRSADASLQRSEWLGGARTRVGMAQVLQTSSTDEVSPQGNTAAYSLTTSDDYLFEKSFTEHGVLFGICVIRPLHLYQYALPRIFKQRDRYDFYWPSLNGISEQPVYNYEIYAQGTSDDMGVFGYQEYAAWLRYKPSSVHNAMRSDHPQSLDVWHYADLYASLPTLSSEWMHETPSNIDRTLAVSSEVSDQFLINYYFDANYSRPLPLYSIPGMDWM